MVYLYYCSMLNYVLPAITKYSFMVSIYVTTPIQALVYNGRILHMSNVVHAIIVIKLFDRMQSWVGGGIQAW